MGSNQNSYLKFPKPVYPSRPQTNLNDSLPPSGTKSNACVSLKEDLPLTQQRTPNKKLEASKVSFNA